MKLSAQEEYGLRCILSLARLEAEPGVEGRVPATIGQVAEHEGLSTEYAAKLMGILTRAGLVESVRGRNGGYRLARTPDAICVAEVLAVLGGKLYRPAETCDRFSGDHRFCVHSNTCSVRSLWSGLQRMIDFVLSRTTLQDLVATNESNMAEWMRAQFETLAELVTHEPSMSDAGRVTLITPGAGR
ncbi:MAG TPA: Rrf2 family transcriptional regulator [Candidatus Krumholzibacteria bacterium]|jgi:Rrf2 family protein|nr:Rrf2 family transcriptional regulator [Candidatus Krumholzibacteria bacterium]